MYCASSRILKEKMGKVFAHVEILRLETVFSKIENKNERNLMSIFYSFFLPTQNNFTVMVNYS